MAEITFMNVFWGHSDGVLSVQHGIFQWRSKTTEAYKKIVKDEILNLLWSQVGQNCNLKIFQKGGKVTKFSSLQQPDITTLQQYCKEHLELQLEEEKMCSNGGNWGEMHFEGQHLNFRTEDESVLEIPLETIAQCAVPSKNEVELQFHEDDTVAGDEETLVEMRLYVPPGDNEEEPGADAFKQQVLDKANITTVTGQSIVELDESVGTFLTPRGRYAIELYHTFLRMHGKTYDYKIMYSNINRCFLLERPDGISCAFVISLEEPIRQGKQGYPHLVLQLRKEETDIAVNLTSEQLKQYEGNLAERMTGLLPQLVATLFKYLLAKKVYTSGKFKTHNGDRAVKCALKAQEGLLYPLEKSFMFIHKPTNFIRYEEVLYVEFQRYAGQTGSSASRNFDLLVKCRSVGNDAAREFLFSAIDRREFPELSQFLGSKKLKIRNLKESQPDSSRVLQSLGPEEGEIDEEEESEDSDFGPGDSGSDDYSEESLSGSNESEGEDDDAGEKKRKKKSSKKSKKKSKTED